MNKEVNKFGFSLIELLVVIGIIGLLSTMAVSGFKLVQQRGRDSKRVSDIKTIRNGLELFSIEANRYPIYSAPGICINGNDALSLELINASAIKNRIPSDPLPTWRDDLDHCFRYMSEDGSTYELRYYLETTAPGPIGENFVSP